MPPGVARATAPAPQRARPRCGGGAGAATPCRSPDGRDPTPIRLGGGAETTWRSRRGRGQRPAPPSPQFEAEMPRPVEGRWGWRAGRCPEERWWWQTPPRWTPAFRHAGSIPPWRREMPPRRIEPAPVFLASSWKTGVWLWEVLPTRGSFPERRRPHRRTALFGAMPAAEHTALQLVQTVGGLRCSLRNPYDFPYYPTVLLAYPMSSAKHLVVMARTDLEPGVD